MARQDDKKREFLVRFDEDTHLDILALCEEGDCSRAEMVEQLVKLGLFVVGRTP